MDKKNLTIIILETSHIIYEGIVKILNQSMYNYTFYFANNLDEFQQLNLRYTADVVIVNPVLLQNIIKEFTAIQKEFNDTIWIGIVYAFIDHQMLSLFDGMIYINDVPHEMNKLIRNLLNNGYPSHPQNPPYETLSEREIEVLKLLVIGNANKVIADKLNISPNTVISHRKNISQKTGIKSVSGLTIYAVVNNFISIDSEQK